MSECVQMLHIESHRFLTHTMQPSYMFSGRLKQLPARLSPSRITVLAMSSSTTSQQGTVIIWFRNDLRLKDNPIVYESAELAKKTGVTVAPCYVIDNRFLAQHSTWGTPKCGPFRAAFLLQSIMDLKKQLNAIGSDLIIRVGKPEVEIPKLIQSLHSSSSSATILAASEVTSEEIAVEQNLNIALKSLSPDTKLKLMWSNTLYHKDDLPFYPNQELRDMSDVFTPFKQKVEDKCQVRRPLPAPQPSSLPLPAELMSSNNKIDVGKVPGSIEELNALLSSRGEPVIESPPLDNNNNDNHDPRGVLLFNGGETEALKRLKYYLWDSDLLSTYFETRNGMIGGDYSTKFAPWLALGCIAPTTIYAEIKKYEQQRTANKSTYWVIFELIWRDFFKFFALKHGSKIFHSNGIVGSSKSNNKQWSQDALLFKKWKTGTTGWPLVDANMRELAATGFMSNRGRQNVASFLVLDLGIDWRLGGDYFENKLIDYDVASNWGNWVSAAGLTGGRVNKFNIIKQSKDYDPMGEYIKLWCPELGRVPPPRIYEPWLMSKEEQEKYGCVIGVDYPVAVSVKKVNGGGGGETRFGNGRRNRGGKDMKGRRSDFEMYG